MFNVKKTQALKIRNFVPMAYLGGPFIVMNVNQLKKRAMSVKIPFRIGIDKSPYIANVPLENLKTCQVIDLFSYCKGCEEKRKRKWCPKLLKTIDYDYKTLPIDKWFFEYIDPQTSILQLDLRGSNQLVFVPLAQKSFFKRLCCFMFFNEADPIYTARHISSIIRLEQLIKT